MKLEFSRQPSAGTANPPHFRTSCFEQLSLRHHTIAYSTHWTSYTNNMVSFKLATLALAATRVLAAQIDLPEGIDVRQE